MPAPPWKSERGVGSVLDRWLASSWVKPCFCADETLAGAEGSFAPYPAFLAPSLREALQARGVEQLYDHQARAIEAAVGDGRVGAPGGGSGKHVVVATPTASGKSLCFHLPVLQALARRSRRARASTSSRPRRSRAIRRRGCAS